LCQKKMIKEGILEYQERIKKKKPERVKIWVKTMYFPFLLVLCESCLMVEVKL
jgi:hypothetical protein